MILREMVLTNWGPFRGEHRLVLGPIAYAVLARLDSDPERSNALGKSKLVGAVPFALHGWLDPDQDHKTLDDLISRGEKEGGVRLVLDGGEVSRTKRRGASVKFEATFDGERHLGDRAEEEVRRRIGLSPEDFRSLCFVRQGETGRLATATAADFTRAVVGWLGVGGLARAASLASDEAGEVEEQLAEREAAARSAREIAAFLRGGSTSEEAAREAAARAKEALVDAEEAVVGSLAARDERALVDEYDRILEEGIDLAREVEELPEEGELESALAESDREVRRLRDESAVVAQDFASKTRLARGEFDGLCPVAGVACPARESINSETERNRALFEASRARVQQARASASRAEERRAAVARALAEDSDKRARLESLRARSLEIEERAEAARVRGEPPSHEGCVRAADEARLACARAGAELERVLGERRRIAEQEALAARHEAAAEPLRARLRTLREASVLLGRGGAQRRVAEGALGDVERVACEMLARAGTGLSLRVRWSREGSGRASACAACGEPFPRSAKAKTCSSCGAERGPNSVEEAELELSRRSGGAIDFAGLAFRLAASRWLRVDRGAAWATALLDEPTAQLDQAHRRTLSARLPSMLLDAGFRQALVVTHDARTTESFPGKILVASDGSRSRVEVVG